MKLSDLKNTELLQRPEGNKRTIDDGLYEGVTTHAELQEWDSKFSNDNTRVVLSIKIEVEDSEGELVDLYVSPNYSWGKKGNMVKVLEGLEVLPEPGESLKLADLAGIPVQVLVENVEKDGDTYSNVVRVNRIRQPESSMLKPNKVKPKRRPMPIASSQPKDPFFDDDEFEDDAIDDLD